ncbi:pyridoxamine 5'-phosphate oxidase family protein [Polaromonas sp. CG_9.11]|uniref:pyridoxamine 5'-phosphate oxidase family protein n=1 Tax=Polaromonas sp. CG_9.11 TaxID=2787730 RepID=UPI0018CAC90E|nr:pyridoxamine 5'-phosphate oxidase family protein [Polaromonas sp. CG_9.11]MBG6075224.1 general stress protein 26 [Polaromonas sp. CG_9.11]
MQMHIQKTDLKDMAKKMCNLDIASLVTVAEDGLLAARPMSNNADVDFDGKSYYFTYEASDKVKQISGNPEVQLAFEGDDKLYVTVTGRAELIRDKAEFDKHWVPELGQWFAQGTDTPGMVLLCVKATHAKYWQDMEMGEWRA